MACCEGMTRWWFEEFSARTECLWRIAGESVAGLVEPLRDRLECSLCHGRLVVRLAPFDGIHFSSAGLIVSFLQSFLVGFLYVWWSFSSIQLRRIAIGMTWFCSRETVFLLRFGKRHPFRSPRKLLPNDPCCTCRWWWWRWWWWDIRFLEYDCKVTCGLGTSKIFFFWPPIWLIFYAKK